MNRIQQQDYAKNLYLKKVKQEEIAIKVGVSVRTIQNWIKKQNWKEQRAAMSVTTHQLIPKLFKRIDEILSEDEFDDKAADRLAKVVKSLERFNAGVSVIDEIDVFMSFGQWLQARATIDAELDQAIIQRINTYQDSYISERISHGK